MSECAHCRSLSPYGHTANCPNKPANVPGSGEGAPIQIMEDRNVVPYPYPDGVSEEEAAEVAAMLRRSADSDEAYRLEQEIRLAAFREEHPPPLTTCLQTVVWRSETHICTRAASHTALLGDIHMDLNSKVAWLSPEKVWDIEPATGWRGYVERSLADIGSMDPAAAVRVLFALWLIVVAFLILIFYV